jgi:hypothetical protein
MEEITQKLKKMIKSRKNQKIIYERPDIKYASIFVNISKCDKNEG